MDESEFVVVDGDHSGSTDPKGLNEAVLAYEAARDSLLKGVSLLHDTLSLAMELALKNSRPDFESDPDDLMERILGSLNNSPKAVLLDHVKSLCSKLVAIKAQCEDLANKYEMLDAEKACNFSHAVHLSSVLSQIECLLLPYGDVKLADSCNLESMGFRAESIRNRLKLVLAARPGPSSDSKADSREQLKSSASKTESDMNLSDIVREEVASALRSEMGSMMENQKDFFQQALETISKATPTVEPSPNNLHNNSKSSQSHDKSSHLISSSNQTGPKQKPKPSYLPDDEKRSFMVSGNPEVDAILDLYDLFF